MFIFVEIRDISRFAFSVLFNLLSLLLDVPLFFLFFFLPCIFYSNLPYLFGMHIFFIHGLVDFYHVYCKKSKIVSFFSRLLLERKGYSPLYLFFLII